MDLSSNECGIGVEGAHALADLLRRDGLPALETLCFSGNKIQDEGVVALAEALCEMPQTSLKELDLADVDMSDVGMKALALLVRRGPTGRMRILDLLELLTQVTKESLA